MTDALDRAVDALIDVYRPDNVPPFEVVQARRRARDRRRGAAAVTAVALAVVGIAFVPSMLSFGGDAQDAPPTVAEGAGEPAVFEYRVQTDDAAAYRAAGADALTDLEVCLLYPGLSDQFTLFSGSPAYGGRVAGQAQADAFTACVEKVPGMTATLTPADQSPEDAGLVWTGAQICLLVSNEPCRQLDAEQAAALDRVLDRAVPEPAGTIHCAGGTSVYRVQFQHPRARTVPIDVPVGCGPVMMGNAPYLLDNAGRDEVRDAFDGSGPGASPAARSAPVPEGACGASGPGWPVGSDVADYKAYEGLTVAQAEELAGRNGDELRVLGQDGVCVGPTTADLRGKRVNLYLDSGVVVSAYAG